MLKVKSKPLILSFISKKEKATINSGQLGRFFIRYDLFMLIARDSYYILWMVSILSLSAVVFFASGIDLNFWLTYGSRTARVW